VKGGSKVIKLSDPLDKKYLHLKEKIDHIKDIGFLSIDC